MTFSEFKDSLQLTDPPEHISSELKSLWFDANGNWKASHDIAQEIYSSVGSLIHAYLHRKEGDIPNAQYWYKKAGKPLSQCSLTDEWKQIVEYCLNNKY